MSGEGISLGRDVPDEPEASPALENLSPGAAAVVAASKATVEAFERRIRRFQDQLTSGEEMWVVAQGGPEFFVEDILETVGRMVILQGTMGGGERVELLCDYSQLSILLVAKKVKPEAGPPRRARIRLGRPAR